MSVQQIPVPRSENKPVRVLHIVENLHTQAVENWLLRILKRVTHEFPEHHWTFFCIEGRSGVLDKKYRKLGATVIHSRYPISQKIPFLRALRKVMREGRYDVLHCHHDIISAVYLAASIGLPFRRRIVHVHNTAISILTPSKLKTRLLRRPMRQLCLTMADRIAGISADALAAMLAQRAGRPNRDVVVHYGVDTSLFSPDPLRAAAVRESLELPRGSRLILFVGRLDSYKNPGFVIEMLKSISKLNPEVAAVFAGAGTLGPDLRKLAKEAQLTDRVRLLGFREDVPILMQACDLLIWPSLEEPKEGLGLGIIEAQAAGLPILMSRSVPDEAILVSEIVSVLPLAAGPKAWAQRALEMLDQQHLQHSESLARVEASSFSMAAGVANLMALYEGVEN